MGGLSRKWGNVSRHRQTKSFSVRADHRVKRSPTSSPTDPPPTGATFSQMCNTRSQRWNRCNLTSLGIITAETFNAVGMCRKK